MYPPGLSQTLGAGVPAPLKIVTGPQQYFHTLLAGGTVARQSPCRTPGQIRMTGQQLVPQRFTKNANSKKSVTGPLPGIVSIKTTIRKNTDFPAHCGFSVIAK
jgi:hypothetical protein